MKLKDKHSRALSDASQYNTHNYTLDIFESLVRSGYDGVGKSILGSLGVIPVVALRKIRELHEAEPAEL